MTLSLVTPSAPARVGVGIRTSFTTDQVGPIPVDDVLTGTLQDLTNFATLAQASVATLGLRDVTLEWGFAGTQLAQGFAVRGVIDGGSIRMHVDWKHANGTIVESYQNDTWQWDPVSGLYSLLTVISPPSIASDIAIIKAAVRRTFPEN